MILGTRVLFVILLLIKKRALLINVSGETYTLIIKTKIRLFVSFIIFYIEKSSKNEVKNVLFPLIIKMI